MYLLLSCCCYLFFYPVCFIVCTLDAVYYVYLSLLLYDSWRPMNMAAECCKLLKAGRQLFYWHEFLNFARKPCHKNLAWIQFIAQTESWLSQGVLPLWLNIWCHWTSWICSLFSAILRVISPRYCPVNLPSSSKILLRPV